MSEKTKIHYTKPSITELEVEYATDAARNGWGEKCYDYIVRFEKQFREFLDVEHVIATSSCTGALHMGFSALGLQPGDEVIMADTNWIASAAPITYLGAKPVIVDILPDTWCLDPDKVEKAITPNTRAILAVHLYGNVCDMESLLAIGEQYNLPVIEDAAEGIGSRWQGKHVGGIGRFGAFSFHGTKTLTTGEGGMFVTNDSALYERVLTLSNHGRAKGEARNFWPAVIGYKYKMSNVQAAIGCAQMERADEIVQRKRDIFYHYLQALEGVPGIHLNPEYDNTVNGFWMPTVVFSKELNVARDDIEKAFAAENIDARPFFWPLSSLDFFPEQKENIHAWSIPDRAINIPGYHDMKNSDQDRVVQVVKSLASNQGRP